jgi:hypothetical protein
MQRETMAEALRYREQRVGNPAFAQTIIPESITAGR